MQEEYSINLRLTSFHARRIQRIRSFLWLIGHDKLLTNVERVRRHLSDSMLCPLCSLEAETVLHVVRDCPLAQELWSRILPMDRISSFFAADLHSWMGHNLSLSSPASWPVLFGTSCWLLWSWRNKSLFQPNFTRPSDPWRVATSVASGFTSSWEAGRAATDIRHRVWKDICWTKPPAGYVKVNTDGASRGNPGPAGSGGLIRDEGGNWIVGFMHGLGFASSVVAELWGLIIGLKLAWDSGFRRVILEVDSLVVKDMVEGNSHHSILMRPLLDDIQNYLRRDWEVQVQHVFREGNSCADWLARRAVTMPYGTHVQSSIPNGLGSLLLGDVVGVSMPRLFLL